MARFGKCPKCHQLTLLAIVKQDLMGDLVAFLKCVNCDYEDKKKVADSLDLESPYQHIRRLEDAFGPHEDDDD
jgi:Zn ribbon nucleic-acid-binding protein